MLLLSMPVYVCECVGCSVVVLRAFGIIYLHFMLQNKQDAYVLSTPISIRTPMRYSIIQHDFESTSITNHARSVCFVLSLVVRVNWAGHLAARPGAATSSRTRCGDRSLRHAHRGW